MAPARNAAGGFSVHCRPAQGLTSAIVVDVVEVLVVEELVVEELVVLEVVELDVVELEVVVVCAVACDAIDQSMPAATRAATRLFICPSPDPPF
ncbi:MAG: hypothetical protein M3163_12450 [Actinomycetota bacterium]|nr:hypothetical protein [Actinomycetota bacterium]